jgi:hypothetical protein
MNLSSEDVGSIAPSLSLDRPRIHRRLRHGGIALDPFDGWLKMTILVGELAVPALDQRGLIGWILF